MSRSRLIEETTTVETNLDLPAKNQIRVVFEYWQHQCGHPKARLTNDRRQKISGRLRDGYTAEEICKAIDGAAKAAFVDPSGVRHDDIELICRNGSKLELFIERAKAKASNNGGPSWQEKNIPSESTVDNEAIYARSIAATDKAGAKLADGEAA